MSNICSIHGTLVVVISTPDAVVVAADEYATVGRSAYPGPSKLHTVPNDHRTVFTITGTSKWLPRAPTVEDEIRAWVLTATPTHNVAESIQRVLSESSQRELTEGLLAEVGSEVARDLATFFGSKPHLGIEFREKIICRLIVVRFCAQTAVTAVAQCSVTMSKEGRIRAEPGLVEEEKPSGRLIKIFGEKPYFDSNVQPPGSAGHRYLMAHQFPDLWNAPNNPTNAAKVAASLIAATEMASKEVPIATAVGGTPTIWVIDGNNPPYSA